MVLKPLAVWIITNYGKLLKRWEYQTIVPVFWETWMRAKKQQLTSSQLRKEDNKAVCILSPCLFNFYAEHILLNPGLQELQAGIKTARRNVNNVRYVDGTTLTAEGEKEIKSFLMRWKRRVKSQLKTQQ